MGIRCSYCQDGPFKRELIDEDGGDGLGGLINGYWFCAWCYELGMKKESENEEERMRLLTEEAESRDSVQIIQTYDN